MFATLCLLLFFRENGMNVIVGSSRSRDLGKFEPLKSNPTVEIWSVPGGKYCQLTVSVDEHMLYHHGGPMPPTEKTHFYIVAGLCNITKKINRRQEKYTEVIYDQIPAETARNTIQEIQNLKTYILAQKAVPIFCTIIPSHISTQNNKWFDQGITSSLHFSHRYEDMQSGAMEAINIVNDKIPIINSETGVSTPFLHQTITHRKSKNDKRRYQFSLLHDDCHTGDRAHNLWAKCIGKAIVLNRS
jgi:hypothetical protein